MQGPITALFRQPMLLLALTALFWAGNAVASRLAVGEVSPFLLVFLRWGLAWLGIIRSPRTAPSPWSSRKATARGSAR